MRPLVRWLAPRPALLLPLAFALALLLAWAGAPDPRQAAGAMTVARRGSATFEQPAAALTAAERARHAEADRLFDRTHVPLVGAPGAGLGPRFIADSCIACHVRNGRGRAVTGEALLRVALRPPADAGGPAERAQGAHLPVPGLGLQLQDRAVLGLEPEARLRIGWDPAGPRLRRPRLRLEASAAAVPDDRVARSLRIPPPLIGLGLLEAVPTATLEALADPDDRDGDGISGRVHWRSGPDGARVAGRFGWKALSPSLREQTAAAYANDMGLTTPVGRGSERAADGRPADLSNRELDLATFYSQTLGAPRARRDPGGVARFRGLGCAGCHVPLLRSADGPGLAAVALRDQPLWAWTDLLLHDMGPGLDDGVAEGEAASSEWRTPPLWGIGLTQRVNPGATWLHDGRARSLEEAILWHDGEARRARERYEALPRAERRQLLAWLERL